MEMLVIAPPSGAYRVSGSRPRFPTSITLLTDAMIYSPQIVRSIRIHLQRQPRTARSTASTGAPTTISHNATTANPNTKTDSLAAVLRQPASRRRRPTNRSQRLRGVVDAERGAPRGRRREARYQRGQARLEDVEGDEEREQQRDQQRRNCTGTPRAPARPRAGVRSRRGREISCRPLRSACEQQRRHQRERAEHHRQVDLPVLAERESGRSAPARPGTTTKIAISTTCRQKIPKLRRSCSVLRSTTVSAPAPGASRRVARHAGSAGTTASVTADRREREQPRRGAKSPPMPISGYERGRGDQRHREHQRRSIRRSSPSPWCGALRA